MHTRTRQPGFTLVELIVVIVVIALLTALAVPSLDATMQRASLRTQARELFDTARYTQRMATIKRRTIRLVLVPEDAQWKGRSSYRIEVMSEDVDAEQTYLSLTGGPIKPTIIVEPVRIVGVDVVTGDPADETLAVRFHADGTADGAIIRMQGAGLTHCIVIEPMTGRAELVEDTVTSLPSLREDLDA